MSDSVPAAARHVVTPMSSARRWLYAAIGVFLFGLGILGAMLPGLPTTIFLLGGSYFLTRSCPWLERTLRSMPILRPYVHLLDPATPMSRRGRWVSSSAMWVSIAFAIAVFPTANRWHDTFVTTMVVAGLAGTVAVWRFRRHLDRPESPTPPV